MLLPQEGVEYMDSKKTLVLVVGMHRSGTSVLAQIMQNMGVYLGRNADLQKPAEDNPDGFFEHSEIVKIHEAMLNELGKEWFHAEAIDLENFDTIKYEIILKQHISSLFENHNVVGVKDPRICLFLPMWKKFEKDLKIEVKYLYILRNCNDVAASIFRRDGIDKQYGVRLWKYYNVNAQISLWKENVCRVYYEELMNDTNIDLLNSIYSFIYQDEACPMINDVRKQSLYHNRQGKRMDEDCLDIYNRNYSLQELLYIKRQFEIKKIERNVDGTKDELLDELKSRKVIIYGAGREGTIVADVLDRHGVNNYFFCDRSSLLAGTKKNGRYVLSVGELNEMKDLMIIISVSDEFERDKLTRSFVWMSDFTLWTSPIVLSLLIKN